MTAGTPEPTWTLTRSQLIDALANIELHPVLVKGSNATAVADGMADAILAELPAEAAPAAMLWRTGRKVGRTIYAQLGPEPTYDSDPLIGVMDTPELAAEACAARNAAAAMRLAGEEREH